MSCFPEQPVRLPDLKDTLVNATPQNSIHVTLPVTEFPLLLYGKSTSSIVKKKFCGKVTKADFRDKTIGWNTHKEAIWIDDNKHILNGYTYLFYENDIERPSCYNCKYSNLERPADLTLADFWGIDRVVENFNDNKGVSLLLVNSEKGSRILNKVIDNIHCVECDLNASIKSNPNLSRPTAKPDSREDFWDFYYKNGFEKTFKKYYNKIRIKKIKRRIKLKFYSLKNKVSKLH